MLDLLTPFTEGLEECDASSSTPTAGRDPKHEVVEEKSLDEKHPSVVPDAARRCSGTSYQEEEKNHPFPTKRKPQCVHSFSERSQL